MRVKLIDNIKSIVPIIVVFIGILIIIEIIAFVFWSTIYPNPGNGPEVLVASFFTTRLISVPVEIVMIVVLILRVKNLIRSKGVAIFAVSIFVVVLTLSIIVKGMLNTNKISEKDLIGIVIWPNNLSTE